jgi:hypothetical protein
MPPDSQTIAQHSRRSRSFGGARIGTLLSGQTRHYNLTQSSARYHFVKNGLFRPRTMPGVFEEKA